MHTSINGWIGFFEKAIATHSAAGCYTERMAILNNRNVLLGVSGGIAAYKSCDLTRRLVEAGCNVRIVMTRAATEFVTPLTFQALSGNPVHTSLLDTEAEAAMGHIELARWADVILIAPASANTLSKLALGSAEDLLQTVCLASAAPLVVAPAMNRLMWDHPATRANIDTLAARGVRILGPGSGAQACGETGAGRMLEPLQLRDGLASAMATEGNELAGLRLLLTAGPTREQIDPVRFLSNNSSGKMGFALAHEATAMGASVTVVCGPIKLDTPHGVHRIDVQSADDMHRAVMQQTGSCDIFIAVAAVADYRTADVADQKIKKDAGELSLSLVRNQDILASVAALEPHPFCVGFAAETQDVEHYARSKLTKKRLQMIAANPVVQDGRIVFGSDSNSLEVFWPKHDDASDTGHASIAPTDKPDAARQLLRHVAREYRHYQQLDS